MKKVKILLLVVLLCVGVLALASCNYSRYDNWANSENYLIGEGSVEATEVSSISIDWIIGSVEVVVADVENIVLEEKANVSLQENEKMRYLAADGLLSVKFIAPKSKLKDLTLTKKLTIKIPRSYASGIADINIHAVSADTAVNDLNTTKVRIESVSGDIAINTTDTVNCDIDSVSGDIGIVSCNIANLDISSVSGKVKVENSQITDFSIEATSGDIDFTSTIMPTAIKVDGVSSEVRLTLPENSGFVVEYSTVTGEFSSDFAIISQGKDKHQYGDGKIGIAVSTISGNLTISKL